MTQKQKKLLVTREKLIRQSVRLKKMKSINSPLRRALIYAFNIDTHTMIRLYLILVSFNIVISSLFTVQNTPYTLMSVNQTYMAIGVIVFILFLSMLEGHRLAKIIEDDVIDSMIDNIETKIKGHEAELLCILTNKQIKPVVDRKESNIK